MRRFKEFLGVLAGAILIFGLLQGTLALAKPDSNNNQPQLSGEEKYLTLLDDPDQERIPQEAIKKLLALPIEPTTNEWEHSYSMLTYTRERYVDTDNNGSPDFVKHIAISRWTHTNKIRIEITWHVLTVYRGNFFQEQSSIAHQYYDIPVTDKNIPLTARATVNFINKRGLVSVQELHQYLSAQ